MTNYLPLFTKTIPPKKVPIIRYSLDKAITWMVNKFNIGILNAMPSTIVYEEGQGIAEIQENVLVVHDLKRFNSPYIVHLYISNMMGEQMAEHMVEQYKEDNVV